MQSLFRPETDRLPRLVTLFTVATAALVVLALPLAYFAFGFDALSTRGKVKAEVRADGISSMISAMPEMWRFEEHRLSEQLTRRALDADTEFVRVLDGTGVLIVSAGNERLQPPLLTRTAALYDVGEVVGRVEVLQSLRPLWLGTVGATLAGLVLAAWIFLQLRSLPRHAQGLVRRLHIQQEWVRTALQSIDDGVIATDAQLVVEYMNPAAEQLTGWKSDAAIGKPLTEVMNLVDEISRAPTRNMLVQAMRDGTVHAVTAGTVDLVRPDGTVVAIKDSATPVIDGDGQIVGGVLVFRDITQARTMSRRISWSATHDALTGLANRVEFENRVDAALNSAKTTTKRHAMLYIDLDQFKVINDICGHAAGDSLLKQIADLLLDRLRARDTLARLGGDEFGVLLEGCPLNRASLVASDILTAIQEFRFQWDDKTFSVGCSIGLVPITEASGERVDLFSAADAACYAAKEQGRNRVCVFSGDDADLRKRRSDMDWTRRLNQALEQDRFVLYYQAYQSLGIADGGKHVEILLRLIDEDGELVLPGHFMAAAEHYNIAPQMDRWVVRQICARYHDLRTSLGGGELVCSVNLSGTSINTDGLQEFIREQVQKNDIPAGGLCFEITETAAVHNLHRAAEFMRELKGVGLLFSLDDFGVGTSSFGYLKSLPVNYLKIDGSFVRDILDDPVDRAMVDTINHIAHLMGLKTVGEYAENGRIVDELRALGVDYAQGTGVAEPRPVPQAGFVESNM